MTATLLFFYCLIVPDYEMGRNDELLYMLKVVVYVLKDYLDGSKCLYNHSVQ